MLAPTPADTPTPPANVWFEVAAVEVPVGAAGQIVQLPGETPGVLGPWFVTGTQLSSVNGARGQPLKALVIGFARPISPVEATAAPRKVAPAPRAPAAPAPVPGRPIQRPGGTAAPPAAQRRTQPTVAVPAAARPLVNAAAGVAQAIDNAIGNAAAAVENAIDDAIGGVVDAMGGRAPTSTPVSIPEGQGCTCAEPSPAVQNSPAAAVPCLECGGWAKNEPAEQPTA